MKVRDALMLALQNLRRSAVRTCLTVLGLAVGVGAILTVMSLGDAGEVRVEEEIARLGVNKVWITRNTPADWPKDAARKIEQATGLAACAGASRGCVMILDGIAAPALLAGYDEGAAAVHGLQLLKGRMLLPEEWRSSACIALADETLAASLGEDVLSRRVSAAGRKVKIVGIVKSLQGQGALASKGMLIVPLQTYGETFWAQADEITVNIPGGVRAGDVGETAVHALAGSTDAFSAVTLENEIDAARAVVRIFVLVLLCVAAVCMLTGGIGVMNILLVSVRERQQEIGLIKAVGGTSLQVGALFLAESVTYAVAGGLSGVMLGWGMITLFGGLIGLKAGVSLIQAGAAVGCAAALGALCGAVPALRAAAVPPAQALKKRAG